MVNEIKKRIKISRLENNTFYLGFLSEGNQCRVIGYSSLYLLPGYEEDIPVTFCENVNCGLPIVTCYLSTYEEIKDGISSVGLGMWVDWLIGFLKC